MRLYRLNYNQIRIAVLFCLAMLNSGYALVLGNQAKIMVATVGYILFDILFLGRKIVLKKNALVFLLILLIQFIFAFIANLDMVGVKEYIRLAVLLVFCYYIYISYSSRDIIVTFCKFMFGISVISLVFHTLITLFPQLGFKVMNGYGTVYITCFISFVNTATLTRNCGPFWGPGVFAAVCFLWGLLEICVVRNLHQRKMRIVVAMISILSTYSTSGYIYLLLLSAMLILRDDSQKYSRRRVLLVISGIFAGLLLYWNYEVIIVKLAEINPLVFKKLLHMNASVTDRTIGPMADIYVALRHPFGVGVGELTATVKKVAKDVFGTVLHTRTSTITYYCAAFGLWSGITVLVSLMKFVRRNTQLWISGGIAAVGILFMTLSSPLQDSAIFITLLMIGIQEHKILKQKEERGKICEFYGRSIRFHRQLPHN